MPAGRGRQQVQEGLDIGSAVAVGADPDQVVQRVGAGEVGVHPRLVGEVRVDGHAEQPRLVHRHLDRQRRERLIEDLALAHDPDLADVLVRDEDRAVGRERHVHGEAEPVHLELEPLLGSGRGGEEDDEDCKREAESPDHGASVGGAPG